MGIEGNAGEGEMLTTEQVVAFLTGDNGDTGNQPESGDMPDTTIDEQAGEAAKTLEPEVTEQEPVILAKDGKHIIEYEKLVEAREEAKSLKSELQARDAAMADMQARLEELTAAKAEAVETGDTTEFDEMVENLKSDMPELERLIDQKTSGIINELTSKIAALESQVSAQIAPVVKASQDAAATAHFDAIREAHSDFDAIVGDKGLFEWVDSLPGPVKAGYEQILQSGTAHEVISALSQYKAAAGIAAPPKAEEKPPVAESPVTGNKMSKQRPVTLSDIPAGSAAHHDEAEAMLSMSASGLTKTFAGKTPDQILTLVSRVV